MSCFYIEKKEIVDDKLIVRSSEARHIVNALRLKKNDDILMFDSTGDIYNGTIIETANNVVEIKIISRKESTERKSSEIVLAQAVIKGKKMDFVVQKSTELGVSGITPFFSSRCIPKWDALKADSRVSHWQKIVASSVKQSGIRKMPIIENVLKYEDILEENRYEGFLKLIFWENEEMTSLKKLFSLNGVQEKIIFIVGPEGGFSENEVLQAKASGFIPVSLGNYMLRAETVSSAVLTIIRYENGEMG